MPITNSSGGLSWSDVTILAVVMFTATPPALFCGSNWRFRSFTGTEEIDHLEQFQRAETIIPPIPNRFQNACILNRCKVLFIRPVIEQRVGPVCLLCRYFVLLSNNIPACCRRGGNEQFYRNDRYDQHH